MSADLTGGMDASSDYFLGRRPDDPEFRESVSVWVSDNEGLIGMPRLGIEAVGASWEQRGTQVNVGFPDGRAIVVRELGHGRSPVDDDGVCRTFGAGGLEFRCIEPFTKLDMTYEGEALDTTAAALAAGSSGGSRVALHIEVEVRPVVPPWISGTLVPDAHELFTSGFAGSFISPRYEQLCSARGSVQVRDQRWAFEGTALRVHRQGPRDVRGFWGHCWSSALFPSGRGFGALAFHERPDHQPTYNEAFVFDGERMIPATLADAPWLRRLQPNGEDVSLTLRTLAGRELRIEGETVFSASLPGGMVAEFAPALHQAGIRYRWDGEETFGMMERSIPVDQLQT